MNTTGNYAIQRSGVTYSSDPTVIMIWIYFTPVTKKKKSYVNFAFPTPLLDFPCLYISSVTVIVPVLCYYLEVEFHCYVLKPKIAAKHLVVFAP